MAQTQPGMLLQAMSDLGLDSARCTILGDKMSDIEASAAAGIGLRVLIGSRDVKTGELPHEVVADFGEALALLQSRFAPTPPDQGSRAP
jgi:histidinol phosphatase-like enzyme